MTAIDTQRNAFGQIRIRVHPAWPVMAILVALHLGAGSCVWFTSLPLWAVITAWAAVLCSLIATSRQYLRRAGWQLLLSADDHWFVIEAGGRSWRVTPVSGLFVHEALGMITVADENDTLYPFFLSPCNTDNDSRRRLRVRLRFPMTRRRASRKH